MLLFIFIIQDVNCILFYILILIADEKFSYASKYIFAWI